MTAWDFLNTLLTGGYPLANTLVAILVVVVFCFLFRKAILVILMKKLDLPTRTDLKENEFYHLHKSILLLAKALKIGVEDYKRLYDNAAEDVEKIKTIEELKPQKKGLYVLVQSGDSVAIAEMPETFKPQTW